VLLLPEIMADFAVQLVLVGGADLLGKPVILFL
jgi:hypothetical protein